MFGSPFVPRYAGLVAGGRGLHSLFLLLVAAFGIGLTPGAQVTQGRVVAQLETRVPVVGSFLLRGTFPLPRGTYFRRESTSPFTVLDYDGTPVVTQTEVVSRYPRSEDGADVVEVLARVRRDPALPVDARVRYSVVIDYPGSLPESSRLLPEDVLELIQDPRGVEITGYDCFGNRYVTRPLDRMSEFDLLRHGAVRSEVRVHNSMLPVRPVEGSTLPHLLGVHAYLGFFYATPLISMDLRLHNGHDGHDPDDPLDDPLGTVYFSRIEVSMPVGWVLMQDFADPLFGAERIEGGRRIVSLVAPEPGGGLHVMDWLAQFHRRLLLAPDRPATVRAGRAHLDGAGRAFCVRGQGDRGNELWSWWNRETGRYFPQRLQLPSLDHVGQATLEAGLTSQLGTLAGHLVNGTGTGDYPFVVERLGWGHPFGVSYGGMTGGLEIQFYDGIETAAAASVNGYRYYTALHRMQTDRQPNAMFQLDGRPSSVEEWKVENGALDYVPFEHFVVPLIFGSRPDPFGVRNAPSFQVDYVRANGLEPAYQAEYQLFAPYDYQHLVRYSRAAKVLAWLGNDSLAKDDLCMQAENFHLAYHHHANNAYGNAQGSGLLAAQRFVRSSPGQGFGFGRGESWGMDCAVAAYSCGSKEWRATKLPWFQEQAELLLEGQAACSGFIQSFVYHLALGGRYRARQAIEQSITENALVELHESVFRDADPGYAAMVRDVLERSLRAFIGEMSWFPGQRGPWRITALAPLDPALPVWCSRAEMPSDGWTVGDIEAYQDWSSLAYGYRLTGDPQFLRNARIQIGGASFSDMAQRLRSAGTANLGNRAALLSEVQRIQGDL